MANKYHINPETGRPNQCHAKIQCRFGGESDHYDSKEEARAGYEKNMKDETVSKGLKKSSGESKEKNLRREQLAQNERSNREAKEKLTAEVGPEAARKKLHENRMASQAKHNEKVDSTSAKEKAEREGRLPVIPGVPAVATTHELDQEENDLEREGLYGTNLTLLLKSRGITEREILAAEKSGDYEIETKVPSYYEIIVTTDLARRAIGMKPREKTGIDESDLRVAQIARDNAYKAMTGRLMSAEESKRLNREYRAAERAYNDIRANMPRDNYDYLL
jgi:hypothetical protein